MMNKKVDSTVSSEGRIESSIMFYRIGNKASAAVQYRWDDKYGWVEPKPLDEADMVGIALQSTSAPMILPDNILTYASEVNYSWWTPAKRRRISVKESTRKQFCYPAMVFCVVGGTLRVGCLKRNQRPKQKTIAYSIFGGMDVHRDQAAFCRTRLPRGGGIDKIEEWENAFYRSTFNEMPRSHWSRLGTVGEICTG